MTDFAKFLKTAENVFGSIAEEAVIGDVDKYIDTGSYSLNAIVSGSLFGGFPTNKIVGLARF